MNDQPQSYKGHYAGFVTRFIALAIDIILVSASMALFIAISGAVLNFFGMDEAWSIFMTALQETNPSLHASLRFLTVFGSVTFIFFLYIVLFWVLTGGKTLGKAFMGLRVVRLDGQRLTPGRAILRYLAYWVSVIGFFLGFFWVLWDDRRQTWHDKIARTCVIYDWDAVQDRNLVEGIKKRLQELHKTREKVTRKALSKPKKDKSVSSEQ